VLGAAENIRGAKFEPNPGEFQCHFCDFKSLCPVHKESCKPPVSFIPKKSVKTEEPAVLAAAEAVPLPPGSAAKVEALVDRYGHLKEEMDKLNAQLDQVARELGEIHTGTGKKELSGEIYSMELCRGESWKFADREAVISVLNEFDLYKNALGLTLPKIVAMLSDPVVPEAAKNKLKLHAVRDPRLEINIKKKA
jgi:hypothetical protein